MTYFINKYDGTQIAAIAEGSMDTTSTSLKLLGRNFVNYGEVWAENLVHLLENFASATPPSGTPLVGQLWFSTADFKLYVYNGSVWVVSASILVGNTDGNPNSNPDGPNSLPPSGSSEGELYWDADTQQLWGWNESGSKWVLVGPSAPASTDTALNYQEIDGKNVLVVRVSGVDIAIWSSTQFNPSAPWNVEFPTIYAGLTYKKSTINDMVGGRHIPTITDNYDLGTSSRRWKTVYAKTLIVDELQQTGQAATPFNKLMRTDKTNIPDITNTYDLGSTSLKYRNIYATNVYGNSTTARYADVAERYETDMPLEPGDVVKLGGDKEITKTTDDADVNVFGVISTNPAICMNSDAGNDETHPYVAFIGRVPCKVKGIVKKGQRLVASNIPGVARAATANDPVFSIIGRALEDKNNIAVSIIEVVVGK